MSPAAALQGASPLTVPVPLGDRAYDILVGRGLLSEAGNRIAALGARAAAIVTDAHVGPLYAETLSASLKSRGLATTIVSIAAGESSKSYADLARVCRDAELLASHGASATSISRNMTAR